MGDGTLAERDITEVFQDLSLRGWTGLIRLERPGSRVGVTVEEGRLVFASSSNTDHRLGPLLLRRGVISLRQMEDAVRKLAEGVIRGAARRKLAVAAARRIAIDLWRLATGQTTPEKLHLLMPTAPRG